MCIFKSVTTRLTSGRTAAAETPRNQSCSEILVRCFFTSPNTYGWCLQTTGFITKMPVRSSYLTRCILHPAETWQMSPSRAVRAANLSSARTQISTMLAHQPFFNSQVTTRATQRSLSTTVARIPRPLLRARPGLRSVQLPKRTRSCRYNSSSTPQEQKGAGSLSQRLRKLSREYGWAAVGVYFALSALDFPFCFAAVRLLGVDRIGQFEQVVVQTCKDALHTVWPRRESAISDQGEVEGEVTDQQGRLARAESRNQEEASMLFPLFYVCSVLSHTVINRYLDSTCIGLRNPQEFHLHSGSSHGRRDPQGGEDLTTLGLGYWQAKTQELLLNEEIDGLYSGDQCTIYVC